jgi:2-polyprenyl-3-methyl-5-hydroxy-6-metoxy-1,4-benzoquinol methylase
LSTNQDKAIEIYSNLAKKNDNPTKLAGRYEKDEGVESLILSDILHKLNIEQNNSVLDIGCGCGVLTHLFIEKLKILDCKVTFFDIPEVIKKLDYELDYHKNLTFKSGLFPESYNSNSEPNKFDKICIYSVLQCTDNPEEFIDEAVKMLNSPGRLLIGDIPNINKKGRFLSSEFGRSFDANYHGVKISEVKHFKSHLDYASKVKDQNDKINDELILKIFHKYRLLGHDVYILPQKSYMPFSHTREDLIIEIQ